MQFSQPLVSAVLIRRYKRFLADVRLDDGEVVTVHCPNTGSMLGCDEAGSRVWLSRSDNPKRRYSWTWELVEVDGGVLVGINTNRSNRLVREAIESRAFPEFGQPTAIRAEVPFGNERSRADFLLEGTGRCAFVEVKNVTAAVQRGVALFPDAITTRGSRHLRELMAVRRTGAGAILVFCVQRADAREVRPADSIDRQYGQTLREAISHGVEVVAFGAQVSPQKIEIHERLPVVCP